MTQEHPIRPPHELVQQWVSLACENEGYETWQDLATQAARWGADQELEAISTWLELNYPHVYTTRLRRCRRLEPQTLNSIALQMLDTIERDAHYIHEITDTIRRALESLPD